MKKIKIFLLHSSYIILVILSILIFGILSYIIFESFISNDKETIIKLLVPVGVLLSAGLASTSVMKSIHNTNRIEEEKRKKEHKRNLNKIEVYINKLLWNIYTYTELMKTNNSINFFNFNSKKMHKNFIRVSDLINKDDELLSLIDSDDYGDFLFKLDVLVVLLETEVEVEEDLINSKKARELYIEELRKIIKKIEKKYELFEK